MNIKMNEKPDSVLKEYPTVEVPLPRGKSVSRGLAWISLIMPSVTFLTMLFIIYAVKSQDLSQLMLLIFPSVCAIIFLFAWGMTLLPKRRKKLEKICTARVKGCLEGYEYRHKHERVFAPKYKIFLNGRYEIRTVDDFSFSEKRPLETDFLANPNGYEMIFADNSYSNISVICMIGGTVIGIMLFLSLTYPIWENLL